MNTTHARAGLRGSTVIPAMQVGQARDVELVQSVSELAGDHSHRIELEEFVRAQEIDPVYYDRGYYLGAGKDGRDAYRLLHDALDRSARVGIGRWVFHNREYLVAVRPQDRVLSLQTMRFAAELIDADSLDLPAPSRQPSRREIEMASTLVDSLHDRFDPKAFRDGYRERVIDLVEAKARGEEPELPEAPEIEAAPDLMAALEASLAGTTSRKESKARNGAWPDRCGRER